MNSSTAARTDGALYSRLGKLGVRVMGITLLTLSLGFFVSSSHTIWSEQELLSEQLDQRGEELSKVASLASVEFMLVNDYDNLLSLAQYLTSSNAEVVYCEIVRSDGKQVVMAPQNLNSQAREACRKYSAPI